MVNVGGKIRLLRDCTWGDERFAEKKPVKVFLAIERESREKGSGGINKERGVEGARGEKSRMNKFETTP